jgi:hypothetical protein
MTAKAKASKANKSVVVELPTVAPKKNVVRFDATDENAAIMSAYVTKDAIEFLGGAENGVRITIEAL